MSDHAGRRRRALAVLWLFAPVTILSFVSRPSSDSSLLALHYLNSRSKLPLNTVASALHGAEDHYIASRGSTDGASSHPFVFIDDGEFPNRPSSFEVQRPFTLVNSTVQLVKIDDSSAVRHLALGYPMIWRRRFTSFATNLACQRSSMDVNFASLVECGYCMFRLDGGGADDPDAHWMAYPRCSRFIGTSHLDRKICYQEVTSPLKWICGLRAYERKFYSQHGEDGVLLHILQKLGMSGPTPDRAKRFFVEFGVEDGSECNTRILREHADISQHWTGLLLDGGNEDEDINLHKEYFSPENIKELLMKYGLNAGGSIDVLVIDTDLYDYYILKTIFETGWLPTIIVAEFNGRLGPKVSWTVPRDSNLYFWDETDFFGVSLHAQAKLAEMYGYLLVYVESAGVNAFYLHHSSLNIEGDNPYLSLEDWVSMFWQPPAYASAPTPRYALQLDQTTTSFALPSEHLNGSCVAPYSKFGRACFGHNDDGLMRSFVEV